MGDTKATRAGDFERFVAAGGVEVFVLRTRKFKTKLLRIHVRSRMDRGNAARALVPNLLRRGTRSRPSMLAVSRALEGLYGAAFSSSVYRLGEEQVLALRLDTVEERFLPGAPEVFAPALEIVRELLLEPALENGGFRADVFEQERLNQRREIEAQFNDKHSYAFQRLLDEMFAGEPYGRRLLGTVEETDALRVEDAMAGWRQITRELPARVFAVGDFDPDALVAFVSRELPLGPERPAVATPAPRKAAAAPRVVIERDQVSQSKLLTGRRVDVAGLDERGYDALRVYSSVLGGGFHSRLFQTIRERASLAYYASASLDRLHGVLFTTCGIDAARRERVSELVEREIAALRAAPPREDELEQSRRLLIASSRGLGDSAGGMIETCEAGLAAGRPRTIERAAESLASVTAADVQAAAARMGPLEMVYCLEGDAKAGGDGADAPTNAPGDGTEP